MTGRAVATYDLSGSSGWAVYHPDFDEPISGRTILPSTTTSGSVGPALHHLFNHIAWIDRKWPLQALGFEAFIAPTSKEQKEGDPKPKFKTSQAAMKKLIAEIGVLEMCADMLNIEVHSLHNASWRRYWLGSQPRGTTRDRWKELSIAKAHGFGWMVKGDDDADALGQLHFLLHKLEIKPRWGRNPSRALIELGYQSGVPIHV